MKSSRTDVLMLVDNTYTLQRRFYFTDASVIIFCRAFYHSFVFLPAECSFTFYRIQHRCLNLWIELLANNKEFTQPGRQRQ